MRRAGQWFASAVIGSLWLARTVSGAPVEEPARFFSPALPSPVGLASVGSLTGRVTGPDGTGIVRAPVVVHGAVRRRVITTADGRFSVGGLPPGRYDVDVDGWVVAPRRTVTVVAGRSVSTTVTAQRLPPVSTAGVGLPLVPAALAASVPDDPSAGVAATSAGEDDALAWRLRHARRSVLKSARAVPPSASAPERWWPGLPDTEVHLLSVGSTALPDGVEPTAAGSAGGLATVRLRAPLDGGLDWNVALAMTQAIRSTWSGSAAASLPIGRAHQVGASVAWMALRPSEPVRMPWDGGSAFASRTAGRVTLSDEVHLGPRAAVQLSETVLRMDGDATALRSDPTVIVAVVPADGWQLMGRLSQRSYSILDLTTAARWDALGLNAPDASLTWSGVPAVEHGQVQEVRLERGFGPLRMAVGRVHEQVADGWARVYGVLGDDGVTPTRMVATGSRETSATQVAVDASAGGRVRGGLRIAVGEDRGSARGATVRAASLGASGASTWQDIQALLATDVAGARTQVVLVYRVRLQQSLDASPAADAARVARYAVRVRQPLPFLPTTGTQWDVLMDVSTLATGTASVEQSTADEWHVVRAPRRVIGGLALRF